MFKRFAIVCAIACILTGCGPSYHWTKSHPLYRQVPYSTLSITGTENAFILTRSKWFAKKLNIDPLKVQGEATKFCEQAFLDEMKRAYPTLKQIPDSVVNRFPEESQKIDDRVFIKGHFPEQGVSVTDGGNIPPYILILHEFIIGTDINREVFYDYELIRQESAEKKTSNNLSIVLSYTLWDNENQRPLFSAVDEVQRPITKISIDDLRAAVVEAAKRIRINLYEGVRK
ncbi:hypothetical protein [Fibrobacter sp. UWR2]|uniref:hypothetical protein n=1 Tax=Fibrobacter sp. UWR2 TaxID=1964352 RepID=UPI000B523466|nr:hypothetical protein [Fibrobacter sp. UWR2]OWV00433.1 hypothetical protein B7994_08025 [Fibrobacter sp. UWR2]